SLRTRRTAPQRTQSVVCGGIRSPRNSKRGRWRPSHQQASLDSKRPLDQLRPVSREDEPGAGRAELERVGDVVLHALLEVSEVLRVRSSHDVHVRLAVAPQEGDRSLAVVAGHAHVILTASQAIEIPALSAATKK